MLIASWLKGYDAWWLPRDALAGATTAAVVVPQAMDGRFNPAKPASQRLTLLRRILGSGASAVSGMSPAALTRRP